MLEQQKHPDHQKNKQTPLGFAWPSNLLHQEFYIYLNYLQLSLLLLSAPKITPFFFFPLWFARGHEGAYKPSKRGILDHMIHQLIRQLTGLGNFFPTLSYDGFWQILETSSGHEGVTEFVDVLADEMHFLLKAGW